MDISTGSRLVCGVLLGTVPAALAGQRRVSTQECGPAGWAGAGGQAVQEGGTAGAGHPGWGAS